MPLKQMRMHNLTVAFLLCETHKFSKRQDKECKNKGEKIGTSCTSEKNKQYQTHGIKNSLKNIFLFRYFKQKLRSVGKFKKNQQKF